MNLYINNNPQHSAKLTNIYRFPKIITLFNKLYIIYLLEYNTAYYFL